MKKHKKLMVAVCLGVVALVLIGTVSYYMTEKKPAVQISKSVETPALQSPENTETPAPQEESKTAFENQVNYEELYANYIGEHPAYFERGMMLTDLNDDDIPELYSIADAVDGGEVYYHQLENGAVLQPTESSWRTCVYLDYLIRPTTYFEDADCFLGIYRHKKTGQKVLINSVFTEEDGDRFDIIGFQGEDLVLTNQLEGRPEDQAMIDEIRDAVMIDYELAEDELYTSFLLRGIFGGENGADPVLAFEEMATEFKTAQTPSVANAEDGTFYCYVHSLNTTDKEALLIPAAEITYEEYTKAMSTDKLHTLNGESMSLQIKEGIYEELGIVTLFQMPWLEYEFNEPSQEHPTSVIKDYIGNEPVKVKLSKDTEVRYGICYYAEDGTVEDYETLGRKQSYSAEEYRKHFAEYSMHSYYRATVKDGELVCLDVMYKP